MSQLTNFECVICKETYTSKPQLVKNHAGNQCTTCRSLPNQPPTQARLLQIFDYDPDSGLLKYKRDFSRRYKGDSPVSTAANKYLVLTLDKTYLAHRIIWLMQTGVMPEFVDHIDHDRSNNRWTNLRDSSRLQNAQNKSVNRNNTSGYLGVSFMKTKGKFRASITLNRKHVHLGLFDTAEEANAARTAANKAHQFHENHGLT